MKLLCPYEEKTAELLVENRQPKSADADTLKHAEHCSRCSNVLLAVRALRQSKSTDAASSRNGSAGFIWWKAQLLQKDNALEQITRPAIWVEKFSLIAAICAAIVIAFMQREQIRTFFTNGLESVGAARLGLTEMLPAFQNDYLWLAITASLAAIAIIGGLMLYLSEEKN